MNAHNEQHDSASPVVKQNLTTQPAAAQEAVAEVCEDSTGCRYIHWSVEWFEGHRELLPTGTKLYAAPVAAAPADARSLALAVEQALGWRDGERDAELDSLLETAMSILDRTPAAPGIDLEPLISIRNRLHQMSTASDLGEGWADLVIELMGDVQKLIDASPKGGSEAPTYTTGHCENRKKPGGCPLHNLQCGYPQCDRRQAGDAEVQP